ncbi:MAG: DeoR/GlpR family DNA-binding transcription regulator [Clostridiales bacterium]|jgi:DeoR/GlpR family transcriptional regulator of sugar metabolism|nr:DeoR/GlpR family DNA-binding transcription regulator [Clostridiales bacterium]
MRERLSFIKQYIQEKGEVKLTELEVLLSGTSSMTLRRDLRRLEQTGDVVLTKGGAKSISHLSRIKEELYSKRSMENTAEKRAVAKKALAYVAEGRSIFLDSGTTVMYLAQLLENQKLFITTSAPNIALECVKNPNAVIHLIGGNLSRDNLSLSGVTALDFLKNINIDTAFIASSGYSPKSGFTCGSFDEGEIKKHVISKANKTIILMDSSKFGKNMPFTFARAADADLLLSDEHIPADMKKQFKVC